MGRHLQRKNPGIQFQDHHSHHHHHPGCMWGIFHMLDYHYWHNLKSKLPYKKHGRGRHFRCIGTPKTNSINFNVDEHQELMDSENVHFLGEEQYMESSPSKRSYANESFTKEGKNKHWASMDFPEKSWLQENPIILLHKGTDISTTRLHDPDITKAHVSTSNKVNTSEFNGRDQFKDYADVLEIYKVNKEIFQKSRQYPDAVGTGLHGKTKNKKFTKSGSFPVADSVVRSSLSTTLQHKQNEIWSLPKEDRSLKGSQMPNLPSSRPVKDYHADAMHAIERETRLGWTKLFRNNFKHIKHRIKNALKDNKKKNHQASEKPTSYGSEYDHRKGITSRTMRRTPSIDESMERYVWLFDYSFTREAKWHQQKSLKLTSDDRLPSRGRSVKSYRRNTSLPDMDSFCSSLSTEASHDAPMSIKIVTDGEEDDCPSESYLVSEAVDSAEYEPSNSSVEAVLKWNVVEGGDLEVECQSELRVDGNKSEEEVAEIEDQNENVIELMMSKRSLHEKDETCLGINLSKELAQSMPLSVAPTCFPDDATSSQELPDLKETSHISNHTDEEACSAELHGECDNNVDINHLLHFKLDKNDESDFNYVRDVLEFSGFIGNDCLDSWHSVDQPLNPTLFKDLEALLYTGDDNIGNCDHQVLFDLINEVLLDIHQTSLSYFPKALSYNSRVRPLPTGLRLLEEVWTRISHYLSLRPELEDSLDCVVSQDLSRGGWMNLQVETDCIALELEELIFDELLDEIFSSPDC